MRKLLCLILFLLLITTASGQFGQKYLVGQQTFGQRYKVDPTGLVLWLDQSDPRSYGDLANWHDLSGSGNHGSQGVGGSQPSIVGADGLNGSARSFDGSADNIDCGNDSSLDWGSGDGTVIVWFSTTNTPAASDILVIKGATGAGQKRYTLFVDMNDKMGFDIDDDGGALKNVIGATSVTGGLWHCAAGVRDGNNLRIYIDGVEDSAATDITGYGDIDDTENLTIGAGNTSGGQGDQLWFNGFIDIVIIASRAFTAAEIQRLYLTDLPRHGGI